MEKNHLSIQSFLSDSYQVALGRFEEALQAIAEDQFHIPKLGHSAAWHALHVVEWIRFLPLQDRTANYHVLGWEDAEWLPDFLGTPLVSQTMSKEDIVTEFKRVGDLLIQHSSQLSDDQLNDFLYVPTALNQQKTRIEALQIALMHVAYHQGQLHLSQKS